MSTNRSIPAIIIAAAAIILAFWFGFHVGGSPHKKQAGTATAQDSTAQTVIWTCSMHPQVMQTKPGVCPICNMKLVPLRRETAPSRGGETSVSAAERRASAGGAAKTERKIAYYWDPMMSPPYISKKPGKSPMGMDLVPVYESEVKSGLAVTIDPVVTQNMGIRVARVTEGPLSDSFRTVGYFLAAEPNQYDVTIKTGGYVEHLFANTQGVLIEKGAPLFELYSPDLLVAEEELLAAKRALEALPAGADEALRAQSSDLLDAVREKLELWNVAGEEIDALLRSGKTSRTVLFRSPATGFIMEKNVIAGAAVQAGERLFRIVDLSVIWLNAQIYEDDLPYVSIGETASATVQGAGQRSFSGKIIFINPEVAPETRTASARLSFPNPGFQLKPGMFASVELAIRISPRAVQVPREAVIDTGKRRIVFIAHAGGRFEPRTVEVGAETSDGIVQILKGLAPGDTVVTSGQFLLDTESRTREAIEKLTAP